MKRFLKNFIMVFIILLMVCGLFFTMNYAKEHTQTNNGENAQTTQNNMSDSNMGTPPDNNKSSNTESDNSNDNASKNEPGGNSAGTDTSGSNDNSNMVPGNNGDSNITSGNNDNSNSNMVPDNNGNSSSETPPEKPDDSNIGGGEQSMTNTTISWVYYLIFGTLTLVISLLLIYLMMSKFNKLSFKETFSNSDKVLIYILINIIVCTGFTFLEGKVASNYLISNETNTSENYSSVKEITTNETITSGSYSSSEALENVISASGNISANISGISVTKTGDANTGDDTSFYGTNSAIIAKDSANLTLKNITVKTSAVGANGVFSYGGNASTGNSSSDGTSIKISNSKITTTKDNSGGIMVTGGGNLTANNLTVSTEGISSAAIRSDRGGGKIIVNKGTYTTSGQGSPAIYSTADITVKNAKLTSKTSEGVVIEGKNSVSLDNVTLVDTNSKLNGKSTTYKNIFLYQSMSGDADSGTSSFTAKNSKITTNKGDTLYVTNTTASISLENNEIINNDKSGNFLRIKEDSWGQSGSNGGDVTLKLTNQTVKGNIVVSSISTLSMTMKSNSSYEGVINGDNSAKELKLILDKSSKIKLTGDSYVTSLDDADTSYSNIDFNGYKLYVNGTAIN